MSAFILNNHISDHQPVVLFCDIHVPVHKHKYITIRSKSDEAKATFRSTFKNKHVLNKLDAESTDPNYNYEILEHSLRESHNECFPTRTVRFNDKRHKKTLWITRGIIKSINHRNKLYKILKVRSVPEQWSIWPKHDKSIFCAHVVENIVNCQVLYFYMERRNGKCSKHDFVTWCRICVAFDCARY